MSRRLTTRIEGWVEEGVEAHRLGEDVTWDLSFVMDPNQGPVVLLAFFMPGAVLGTQVQSVLVLQNIPSATEADITEAVGTAIENLRKGRTEQMSEVPANGDGAL